MPSGRADRRTARDRRPTACRAVPEHVAVVVAAGRVRACTRTRSRPAASRRTRHACAGSRRAGARRCAASSTRNVERSSPDADTPYATSEPSRDGWYQSMAAVSSSTDVHGIEHDRRLVRAVAVERTHAQHAPGRGGPSGRARTAVRLRSAARTTCPARNSSVRRACSRGRDASASSAARVRAFWYAAHALVSADVAVLEPAVGVGDLDPVEHVGVIADPRRERLGASRGRRWACVRGWPSCDAPCSSASQCVSTWSGDVTSPGWTGGPGDQVVGAHRVDDLARARCRGGRPCRSRRAATRADPARGRRCRSTTLQPQSSASVKQLLGRVLALGPAVDLDRLVEAGARREHELGVELALRAARDRRPCGRCSGRGCRCAGWPWPAPCAGSSPSRSMRSFECTLATTTSSSAEHVVGHVEACRPRGCRPPSR